MIRYERAATTTSMKLTVLPVTPERWPDLETLFAGKGCSIARGCWCMFYRRSGAQATLPMGTSRSGANRADLKALVDANESPGLIGYRGKVPVARLIEAYPIDKPGRSRDDGMWFGAKSMYDRAGFEEVARRRPTRPVVRLNVA